MRRSPSFGRALSAGAALPARVRAAPHGALALGVLAVAAYLCLVNLDYAALWHDEAPRRADRPQPAAARRHHRLGTGATWWAAPTAAP